MITQLILAAWPVLRRGALAAIAGFSIALLATATIIAALVFYANEGSPVLFPIPYLVACPVILGLLASGGLPAFALGLEGRVSLGWALRCSVRVFPSLCFVAIPGLLGLGCFGVSLLFVFTIGFSGGGGLSPLGTAALFLFLILLAIPCGHIWLRTFAAPACAVVIDSQGIVEAFRRSDAVIKSRRALLVVSVLLPLVPFLVTTPDSVASRSLASVGVSPTPVLVIRGVVAVLALFVSLGLSFLLPVVAYALATNRPIAGYSPPESD